MNIERIPPVPSYMEWPGYRPGCFTPHMPKWKTANNFYCKYH